MFVRKLQKAAEDTEVKQKMSMEDDILDELAELERLIADLEGEKEQERKEKEQAMLQNQALLDELAALRKLLEKK